MPKCQQHIENTSFFGQHPIRDNDATRASRRRAACGGSLLLAAAAAFAACSAGPELARAPGKLGIENYGVDLVVTAVAGPASALPWSTIDIDVTVCNSGTDPSSSFNLLMVLSWDPDPDLDDPHAGNVWVDPLYAGACRTLAVPVNVSVPQGVYMLGAIADPWNNVAEIDEDNNAESGGTFAVGHDPDLRVSALAGPPSALPWDSIALAITVCNQGQAPSWSSDVRLVLSADQAIDGGDPEIAAAPVPPLASGQCTDLAVSAYANVPDGAYHLGAVVDPWDRVLELVESNNSTVGSLIAFGYGPDLVVTELGGPPSAEPWSSFEASATVCNQGTTSASAAQVDLALSSDDIIDPDDPIAGNVWLPWLAAGDCVALSFLAQPGGGDGIYYLGAVVDRHESVAELIESNNVTSGPRVGVGHAPDLVVAAVDGSRGVLPWSDFDAAVTVCNQGTAPSSGGNIDIFLSRDASISESDTSAGSRPLPHLAPGQCSSLPITGYASVPEGAYYLGAIVDGSGSLDELIEDNNAAAGSLRGVGYRPDLVVTAVAGDPSTLPWSDFDATVTVCNEGTQPSGSSYVNLVLSSDATITTSDSPAGGTWLVPLVPGQCTAIPIAAHADVMNGVYTLGALVDGSNSVIELVEANNAGSGSIIGVGNAPDLAITDVRALSSAHPWDNFEVAVTVCNVGTQPAGSASIDVILSSDTTFSPADLYIGWMWIGPLAPAECTTVPVAAYGSGQTGTYHVGAMLEGGGTELVTSNNTRFGGVIVLSP